MKKILLALAILLVAMQSYATTKKIPLKDFFKDSKYLSAVISPTGKYLAVRYKDGTQVKLAILDLKKDKVASSLAWGKWQHIEDVQWVSDDRFIFTSSEVHGYLDTKGGPPSLYAANANGHDRRELFRVRRSGFQILSLLPNDPDYILIGKYHYADNGRVKANKINIHDGRLIYLDDQPVGARGLLADNSGKLRFAYAYHEKDDEQFGKGTLSLHYKKLGSDQWQGLELKGYKKGDSVSLLGFDQSNRYAYFSADLGSPRSAVYSLDTETGKQTKLLSDKSVDINNAIHGRKGVIGFAYEPGRPVYAYLGNSHAVQLRKSLQAAFPDQVVYISSFTGDGSKAVVKVASDRDPGKFFLLDTKTMQLKYLAAVQPQIDAKAMASMKPITLKARDGLTLHGYLTLPQGSDGKNLPMIVNPHGGPHGVRDYWGYNPEIQFFASRGYAVLQVNFRGSGGYGEDFLEAGYRQWGRKMQDDVTDATRWAIKQGIADPKRICIYGGSYGGYAALMGVVREPHLYQCALGYAGVYSLPLMYDRGDTHRSEYGERYLKHVLGTDEKELEANSPAFNADKIQVPIMLAHGTDDIRVPLAQYDAMAAALKKAHKPFIHILRDEGHGFQLEKNKDAFYKMAIKFFDDNTKKQ